MLDFLKRLFSEYRYLVVFIGSAGDNLGIPATGDTVMFAGGRLANSSDAVLWVVMLVGATGAVIADNSTYWLGRLGGRGLTERVAHMCCSLGW